MKQLNQGCTSSLEVNPYLSQVEELKQKLIAVEEKLAFHEDRIHVYDGQIQELKKMVAKEEAYCQGYATGVEELQKKLAKQQMKTNIRGYATGVEEPQKKLAKQQMKTNI